MGIGGGTREIKLINSSNGEIIKIFEGHQDTITDIAKMTDETFVSVSLDKSINFWNITYKESSAYLFRMKNHTYYIIGLKVFPHSMRLISAGLDDSIIFWNLTDYSIIKYFPNAM